MSGDSAGFASWKGDSVGSNPNPHSPSGCAAVSFGPGDEWTHRYPPSNCTPPKKESHQKYRKTLKKAKSTTEITPGDDWRVLAKADIDPWSEDYKDFTAALTGLNRCLRSTEFHPPTWTEALKHYGDKHGDLTYDAFKRMVDKHFGYFTRGIVELNKYVGRPCCCCCCERPPGPLPRLLLLLLLLYRLTSPLRYRELRAIKNVWNVACCDPTCYVRQRSTGQTIKFSHFAKWMRQTWPPSPDRKMSDLEKALLGHEAHNDEVKDLREN